jgi:hypothetical protein
MAKRKPRKKKIDVHLWRAEKLSQFLNEQSDARVKFLKDGNVGIKAFDEKAFKKRDEFEKRLAETFPS